MLNVIPKSDFAGINRYIVGCKLNSKHIQAVKIVGINRYIVGCK